MTQLVTDLPATHGRRRLQISATKRVEAGARASLIELPGTLRVDVVPSDDMVRMVVRSLGERNLVFGARPHAGHSEIQLHGEAELSLPPVGNFNARIAIGDRAGPELARIQIASIRYPDQGIVAFTAQAIVDAELL
jgi:hypothetical protein